METKIQILLSNGRSVDKEFYKSILQQIEEIIPALRPNATYTGEALCGTEFWEELGSKQRLAGQCIAYMVRLEELPLERVGCEHQYPRKYKRK